MIGRRRFMTISAAALGCSLTGAASAKRPETAWRGRAFGADAHIILQGNDSSAAMEAALDTIRRLEGYFSIYDPDSQISKLNRTGQLTMPPEFARLMDEVEFLHQATDGLFDPTVQPLFANKLKAKGGAKRPTIGWQHGERTGSEIRFKTPDIAITLNGIAQGFATDRVSEVLAAHGFGSVIVNIGEFRVGGDPASLTVENTLGKSLGTQQLSNVAMATSSRNGFTFADGSGHILHPENSSDEQIWETVSVVASSATKADGYSTALILTPDLPLARQLVANDEADTILLENVDGTIVSI